MIGVAVNWLLLMVLVLNNQNVGLRYANPTYPFFNHDHERDWICNPGPGVS